MTRFVCDGCTRIDGNISHIPSIKTLFFKKHIWANVRAMRRKIPLWHHDHDIDWSLLLALYPLTHYLINPLTISFPSLPKYIFTVIPFLEASHLDTEGQVCNHLTIVFISPRSFQWNSCLLHSIQSTMPANRTWEIIRFLVLQNIWKSKNEMKLWVMRWENCHN